MPTTNPRAVVRPGARHGFAVMTLLLLGATHFLGCGDCGPACNCDGGGCSQTCTEAVNDVATSCIANCNGGLCKQSISSYSTDANCDGGNCAQSCFGHDCILHCDGGGCRQDCEATYCDVSCDGGNCLCLGKGCP